MGRISRCDAHIVAVSLLIVLLCCAYVQDALDRRFHLPITASDRAVCSEFCFTPTSAHLNNAKNSMDVACV